MGATVAGDPASGAAEQRWRQTSLLGDGAGVAEADDAFRAAQEALATADGATDPRRQREALDQLARHLAQQACTRGRAPVPKRASARDVS